ncbi:MAG: carbohydrate ABC transporter permease [Saccharofermentanales bacterium]
MMDRNLLTKSSAKRTFSKILHFVLVFGICFVILYPLLIKITASFKSPDDLLDKTIIYLPRNFTVTTIISVFIGMDYPKSFMNTVFLSLLASGLAVISCTLVGYGFGRFRFPGKKFWFICVIITMIVPPQTVFLPTYLYFKDFDILGILKLFGMDHGISLINNMGSFSVMGVTAMGFKNGLYIYLIQQFFRNLPKELEEAAYVDGAGHFKTFYMTMLPSATSIISTVFLFSFIWQWLDMYYTSFFMNKTNVLSNALLNVGYLITNLGPDSNLSVVSPVAMSQINNIAALLVILPLLVLYAFTQKMFVESMERSGIIG